MDYRRLGKSGLKLSELSFGSWVTFGNQVQGKDALELMAMAYDAGINFFDNAEIYESGRAEVVMGEALRKLGWGRDTYLVSSKVFRGGEKPTQNGLSRKHVFDACHAALRRLQVDYLDLYYCHRPDVDTPIEETVRAMHDLVAQGKVMYWGTSEWSAQQLTEAWAVAKELRITPPQMEQPQYNLFERQKVEADYAPLYDLMGLGTTIWSPLKGGVLTGKYNAGIPADSRMTLPGYEWLKAQWDSEAGRQQIGKVRALSTLADEVGMPVHHLAILWCLSNPRVSSVILGASRPAQLADNLKALESKHKLTPEVIARIEAIMDNTPAPPPRY
ncbi:MAG: potassium channel beta subunit family protein [Lysobacteraceae bacterium]